MVTQGIAREFKIGQFIRQRRNSQQLTQADLAQQLGDYGQKRYNPSTIAYWEKGKTMPPIDDPQFVKVIAKILGVTEGAVLEAAGFALQDSDPPDELPEETLEILRHATPEELDKVLAMMRLLVSWQGDELEDE